VVPLNAALSEIWTRWDQNGVRLANNVVAGAAGVISVVVTCVLVTTMTATMPSSVAVQVTRAAGTAIVPFMAGATPSGAPNTGGGGSLHHTSDLTGLAVGGAVVLAGLGIMLAEMRRRRPQSPA
jgi:hypothetical protein